MNKFKMLLKTQMPFVMVMVAAIGAMLGAGCEKQKIDSPPIAQTVQETQITQQMQQGDVREQTEIISPIQFDSVLCDSLNKLFSSDNPIIENIMRGDTLFRIINSRQELIDIGGDGCTDLIDFEQYCIIWGRVMAPHTGCNIDSCQLYSGWPEYAFVIDVNIGAEGYDMLTSLYFWVAYPKEDRLINFVVNFNS